MLVRFWSAHVDFVYLDRPAEHVVVVLFECLADALEQMPGRILTEEAIARYGAPEVFNTDQGAQFTSEASAGSLKKHGVRISMDGKGRWLDNVYVERLWRSLKKEEVYRHAYETVAEARKGIAEYLRYFNEERPRQGLDNRTPDDVFYKRKPLHKAA